MATVAPNVIETQGLVRRFGSNLAVDHPNLSIEAGDVFGFLGHNGAGKTTTIRLLNGVLAPSEGSMCILGMNPVTEGARIRARTGVLTETPSLDDRLTARKTLTLYADIFGVPKKQIPARVSELLDLFGLSERADEKVGAYSKGMRQRMALARTLIHQPDIIFLDEPTAALDPVAAREVHQLVRHASQVEKRTVFLCTHNLYEAARLCTQVAVLAHGRILAVGSPADLARQYGTAQRLRFVVAPEQVALAVGAFQRLPWNVTVVPENEGSGVLRAQGIARTSIPEAISALVQQGVRLYEVVQEEATLEDVYFALQEKSGREAVSDGKAAAQ